MARLRKLTSKLPKRSAELRQLADEKKHKEDQQQTEKHQEDGEQQQTKEHQQTGQHQQAGGALTKTNTHRCNICQLTYSTTSSLQRHMKRHEADKPHECQDCDKNFVTKSGLDIHRRKHTGERPYKCESCPKAFTTRSVLIMHTRGHTGEKPYECKVCGARFTQSSTRADHMRRHTGEEQYQCTTCQRKFVTRSSYRVHIVLCQRKSNIECKICKKKFSFKTSLEVHSRTHSKEKPFECAECGRKFKLKITLASHLKVIHSNEKPYKCDICLRSFAIKGSLVPHLMSHSNIGRAPCEKCGKTFSSMRHLKRHQNSPIGCKRNYAFKQFLCRVCGIQFGCSESLRKHLKRCNSTTSHKRFFCDFCREDRETYDGLVAHVHDHAIHGGKGCDNLLYDMIRNKKRYNPAWIVKNYNSATAGQLRDNNVAYITIDQQQVTSSPMDHTPAIHNNNTAGDNQRDNVDHQREHADHHNTAVNVSSQEKDIMCFTSETNIDKVNMKDKLDKYDGRKYLGNTEANSNNLDTKHMNANWETCRDLDKYISTGKLNPRDKSDIEVIKHASVMQRSYPMIEEEEEVCVKEEEESETADQQWEEMEALRAPERQFLENTSLLTINGITTIKCEAPHSAPHT